jgi:hypothetical protein
VTRTLIFFAREPAREAREKGFASGDARDLFGRIARGWVRAAESAGASVLIASPPEDLRGWRRALAGERAVEWVAQLGRSFGRRLELAARAGTSRPGHFVLVGGDVPPAPQLLDAAFAARDSGADAVLAPARDGGVSLISLRGDDLDLLREIAVRRRDVAAVLERRLAERGRRVVCLSCLPDVDGRAALRLLLRRDLLAADLAILARRALWTPVPERVRASRLRPAPLVPFFAARAPPRAA